MKQQNPPLVIELLDRQQSGFELEGSRDQGNPVFLNAPSSYFLSNTSTVVEDGKYRKIRYIKGQDTIYVDEQIARNIKPNPQFDREDLIIKAGTKTVLHLPGTIQLYEFLQKCEFNLDNKDRPESAQPLFRVINTEENAVQDLEALDDELDALDLIRELRIQGKNGYDFEEDKIDYLVSLFGIGGLENYAEKLSHLASVARSRPKYFMQTIANVRAGVKVAIAEAVEFSVINIAEDIAMFSATNSEFFKFKSKGKDQRNEELVAYLLSPRGNNDLTNLKIQLEAKKRQAVELEG